MLVNCKPNRVAYMSYMLQIKCHQQQRQQQWNVKNVQQSAKTWITVEVMKVQKNSLSLLFGCFYVIEFGKKSDF